MNRSPWLAACLGLLTACEPPRAPQAAPPAPRPAPAPVLPQDAVRGDFDGDGTREAMWLVPPPIDSTGMDCVGPCVSTLLCSNPALKPYALPQSIGGELTVFHHLGAGPRDYLGILPAWFTSCWSSYHVLTYRPGGWQPGVAPFATHCTQWEAKVVPIARDPAHAGHVLVRYSELADTSFSVKTKSVPLR